MFLFLNFFCHLFLFLKFESWQVCNILFWSKKPWKYRCLIEIIEWGFCSDDRLANKHAGQRQLWCHDGYLLYFDDCLANEHDGHNDYDAMLYYLFYFVQKLWLDLVWLIPILQLIRMIDIWNYVIVFKLGNSRVIYKLIAGYIIKQMQENCWKFLSLSWIYFKHFYLLSVRDL